MKKAKIFHINQGGYLINVKAYSKVQIAKKLNMTLHQINLDCDTTPCEEFHGEITHDFTEQHTTIKPLTAKQRKVIVAAFLAQIINQIDCHMFGYEDESNGKYILEKDQEKILDMINKEAMKYAEKALGFDHVANSILLINTVREQVK